MKNPLIAFFLLLSLTAFTQANSTDSLSIRSAFYGIDNYLPISVYCPGAGAVDGLVIVFSHQIDNTTLDPEDFRVISSNANVYIPDCAMLTPAGEENELSTVLLVGEFGSAQINEPIRVEIVGDLLTLPADSNDNARCLPAQNYLSLFIDSVIPLSSGPVISFASLLHLSNAQLGLPGSSGPPGNSIGGGCPTGTQQVVQVVWSGGVTPFTGGMMEDELAGYYTIWVDSIGVLVPVKPQSLADLNDNDNYHDICLATSYSPVRVQFEAGRIKDPNGDPNNFTESELRFCNKSTNTSLETFPDSDIGFHVYHSAIIKEWYVSLPEGTFTIEGYDTFMKQIFRISDCENEVKINSNGIAPGLYFIRVWDKYRSMVKKSLLERQ